jgi:cystathionine beta-lyase
MPREGTYLLWIDYSALAVNEDELRDWFINKAKVELYMGSNFGKDGNGYIRMNIAAPRKLLEQALNNMKNVYHKIKDK